MLEVKNLHATVDGKEILKGIDLSVKAGEVHAIMGPNGSGKSTLASVLAGNERFEVTGGEAWFEGENLFDKSIEERARMGLFLGFQYPVEIPGVSMANFLRYAVNEKRKYRGEEPLSAAEFLRMMREKSALVEIDSKLTGRAVNEGFSGGEKKKNEIFQMAMLEPKLAILDETDSGLDIDALRIVATGVTKLKRPDNATIVITHYQRLLDYIVPDVVHVLYNGRIIHSAGKELALKLEEQGYDWLINQYEERHGTFDRKKTDGALPLQRRTARRGAVAVAHAPAPGGTRGAEPIGDSAERAGERRPVSLYRFARGVRRRMGALFHPVASRRRAR